MLIAHETLNWCALSNEWFGINCGCGRRASSYVICWHRWGISVLEKQIKWENADQIHHIPTTLLPLLTAPHTHTQLSDHFSTNSLLSLPRFAFLQSRTPATWLAVPCSPSLAELTVPLWYPKPTAWNTAAYWAPRSASRLGRLHWHRPLFVLAPHIKAAFLASAPSTPSSLLPWDVSMCTRVHRQYFSKYYLLFSCWDLRTTVTIQRLIKNFKVFFQIRLHLDKAQKRISFFMALITRTVIESFRKHRVISGESDHDWKLNADVGNKWRQLRLDIFHTVLTSNRPVR